MLTDDYSIGYGYRLDGISHKDFSPELSRDFQLLLQSEGGPNYTALKNSYQYIQPYQFYPD